MRAKAAIRLAENRKQGRTRLLHERDRFTERGFRGREVLVGNVDLSLQAIKHLVVVHRPPGAAVEFVNRLDDLPSLKFFVTGRHRRPRRNIIGSDLTPADTNCRHQDKNKSDTAIAASFDKVSQRTRARGLDSGHRANFLEGSSASLPRSTSIDCCMGNQTTAISQRRSECHPSQTSGKN